MENYKIMNTYEECEKCRKCCKSLDGSDFVIKLTEEDKENLSVTDEFIKSVNGVCPFLQEGGCSIELGKRPLICRMYPLALYTNTTDDMKLDERCPLKDKYKERLSDEKSEEYKHFQEMKKKIKDSGWEGEPVEFFKEERHGNS